MNQNSGVILTSVGGPGAAIRAMEMEAVARYLVGEGNDPAQVLVELSERASDEEFDGTLYDEVALNLQGEVVPEMAVSKGGNAKPVAKTITFPRGGMNDESGRVGKNFVDLAVLNVQPMRPRQSSFRDKKPRHKISYAGMFF